MPLQPDTSGILVMFPSNINVQLENVKFKGKTLNNLTCFEFFFFFSLSQCYAIKQLHFSTPH